MDIFDLSYKKFKKKVDDILDNISPEELLQELKENGLEINRKENKMSKTDEMSKEIDLIDIAKLQKWYIDIFEQEDSDYPDYRVIGQKNRHIQRILNKITPDKEEQSKIYDIIVHESWNMQDSTFKPICDGIRALGYKVISKETQENGK